MVWRNQRMVGNFTLADEIFGAGELVGKHRGDQVLGPMRASCGGTFLPPRKRGSASGCRPPSANAW